MKTIHKSGILHGNSKPEKLQNLCLRFYTHSNNKYQHIQKQYHQKREVNFAYIVEIGYDETLPLFSGLVINYNYLKRVMKSKYSWNQLHSS